MEAAADQVTVKTEDVDTEDVEVEEEESKRRLQSAKVKEEKSDCLSSKCSSMEYTHTMCTSLTIMNTVNVITINLVLHCNMFQKILSIGLELKRRIQTMITMVSSYC